MSSPVIWGPEGTARSIASGPVVSGSTALSGSGEKNYITNPSAVIDTTGWSISGAGTLVRDTSSNLPRFRTTATGFAFTSSTDEENVKTRFTLDAADFNHALKAQLAYASATANFRIEVWKNSASDYTGAYTELSLRSDDSSGDSYLAATTDTRQVQFDTDTTLYLELRIVHNGSGTDTIYFSDVIVGPGTVVSVPAVGVMENITSLTSQYGSSNVAAYTNTTITRVTRKRLTDGVEYSGKISFTGAPATGTGQLTLRVSTGGLTIDTNKADSTGVDRIGEAAFTDSSTSKMYALACLPYQNGSNIDVQFYLKGDGGTSSISGGMQPDASNPVAIAAGDHLEFKFSVPIAEWAGAPNYAGQNDVEYASNSDGGDDDNTTSFAYGPAGSAFPGTLTTARAKRVRFQTPIQPTDKIFLEVQESGSGAWLPPASFGADFKTISSTSTGFRFLKVAGSDTDVDVRFSRYIVDTSDWGTSNKWRLVKARAGVAVGFGAATATSSGLVSTGVQSFGGVKTFADGVKLPTSGGTASTLDFYEEYSDSSVSWTGVFTATVTGRSIAIRRIGKLVVLDVFSASGTASGAGTSIATTTAVIPSRFRPATEHAYIAAVNVFSNSVNLADTGHVKIGTDGVITIYKDGTLTGAWAGTGSNGFNRFAVCWSV